MSYLRYLYLFAYSGVQRILGCVFALFFPRSVYPMLPFSLDYPFWIALSVLFNVYKHQHVYTLWNYILCGHLGCFKPS
jgi:hypothetical protein